MLSDQQFIKEFEQTSLDPAYFDHRGHIRLAWLYLNYYSEDEATKKVITGIKRYAAALGVPEKFHMTMTRALTKIVALRGQSQSLLTWQEFYQINSDLINNAKAVVADYYSDAVIASELARASFIPPDKRDF